jgi:hypothetical protein
MSRLVGDDKGDGSEEEGEGEGEGVGGIGRPPLFVRLEEDVSAKSE